MKFTEYQLQLSPTFFQEPYPQALEIIFGKEKDDLWLGASNAVSSGFVQTAPLDALDSLGYGFNLDRYKNYTDDRWRQKLANVWPFWQTSGTPSRLISEVKDLGFTNVGILPEFIEITSGLFKKTLPIVDPNPCVEDCFNYWSNFWIIIAPPHSYGPVLWGTPEAGLWGGGLIWGDLTGDFQTLRDIENLTKKLKPAWTSCRGVVFITDDGKVWSGFNWADGTKYGVFSSGSFLFYRFQEQWEYNENYAGSYSCAC